MQTKLVKLSQIHVNNANPRSIKDSKFDKLVTSLLVLPKMLELRPIVVDNTMTALGGNMRYRALCAIVDLDEQSIRERLESSKDYQAKTQAERDTLVSYWLGWKDNPTAPVINANNLSDAEKREFVIKDNVSFGEWDYDALANEWESDDLNEWGVNVWGEEKKDNDAYSLNTDCFDDVQNNGFIKGVTANTDLFQMAILLPVAKKSEIEAYVKKNGKSELAQIIVDKCCINQN